MRFPAACYQMLSTLDTHFSSCLRPAQRRGLACWVYGTITAQSACQNAVIAALVPVTGEKRTTVRQYLREWLRDGADKAAACQSQVEVSACFVPLLRWVLSLWRGRELPLAIDVTNLDDRLHALCVSVVYRGCAIPVAWHIMPGGKKGAWLPHLSRLLTTLAPAIPAELEVLVLMDGGLRSPTLWQAARKQGWQVIQRHEQTLAFRPDGWHTFHAASSVVREPGQAWVGTGVAFKTKQAQRRATLVVVWEQGHDEPCVLLTDVDPALVGVAWYRLRFWIECGFRILKGMGWQWQKTQRTDPDRVARHWLVLAVASCWVLATGTRVEDATAAGHLPARHWRPPRPTQPTLAHPRAPRPRLTSVFQLGIIALQQQCHRARLWQRLWLAPEPWPQDPSQLTITRLTTPTQEAA